MTDISDNIQNLRFIINAAAKKYQRDPRNITLLAVSKGQTIMAIEKAYQAGIREFGENRYQEAMQKMETLKSLDIHWHFLGPIQSNKAKGIARHFNWVHSLSRIDIAELLNGHRPQELGPLYVCLQINLDNEANKSGIPYEKASALAQEIRCLPNLRLRGLMAIPKPLAEENQQYDSLLRLKNLFTQLNADLNLEMDTLSMGMSNDFVAAIHAGSTIVRVGRALFGERELNQQGH
ncbi:YggS family pyridoxal phosphate-dependent enzyme [Legionella jordanis]|uniref:Pyridoxal phosphate homeostasis protein n=1 Tax=Legionella jordanis TaxID=456 RepID=A0A0W0V9C8_9GAMM|nr:YggS family pyridoxal phosphate-dependent enzyme [Legionella jordanis]KTD16747.1 pyridoxal-5'-phosphate dependent enzyme family transporter protein [Legionella jordanis]RMX03725.1 YggS family pyridoxal phosphate-dependent enzyme [Legionella jordanis]VEH11785.1 pyridoxal-5'-phosphate dependent enzyme family [Legionella jordanis]HAT8712905.1 YggS family pyridoxal phosphate-dependent enzyme [Legionella jordanis]